MIARLRNFRLNRRQLILLAVLSSCATGVVVAAATGRTPIGAELAAILHRREVVVRRPGGDTGGSSAGGGSGAIIAPVAHRPATRTRTTTSAASSTPTTSTTNTTTSASNSPSASTSGASGKARAHVFVIALSAPSYSAAFGRRAAHSYLDATLRRRGTLLAGYHSLSGAELPDYLAMVSGQAPNAETRRDCPAYDDFPGSAKPDRAGLIDGPGCVYPNTVLTVGDQVTAAGRSWKAYISDMGTTETCVHPNSDAHDDTTLEYAGPEYDTRHNPFIYFHSLLDLGGCSTGDVDLSELPRDLSSLRRTPELSFIAPPLCDDASETSCRGGRPGGLAGEDAFLRTWVTRILRSPAYRHNGVLVIAFAPSRAAAESGASGSGATISGTAGTSTTSSTTGTTTPGTTSTSTSTTTSATPTPIAIPAAGAASGIRIGALVLSRYARAGVVLRQAYTPYSLLRSIERLLGLTGLGEAAHATSFLSAALARLS